MDKAVQPLLNTIASQQCSRRCNMRIYGIPEKKGQNCYDAVLKFCKNDLKCAVALDEIDRTHHVGNLRGDFKPRAIIVKFFLSSPS